ncbi:MAG: NUDIX hydrolase [Paracoccus sp. (in: a-proteobacteria)]|uniref:NUDIX hydrolase n=1 Tax=Paracoccus sp. TaxID=267 RepID=UPI0026E0743A|nr:NUDIX hydrolase [Paracoccus sp. (in: a-proteobacteria)]MDO5612431.1 NUDIX hydrolase [Paracoccus sp. (in: a-proteobacteria)]
MSGKITAAAAVIPAAVAGSRLQVGAICRDPRNGKVLLITSRGTGRWIIPKGWPMSDRSDADAAFQEAWEEAGVKGKISRDEVGRYDYDKLNDSTGVITPVQVRVFVAEVSGLADSYPEAGQRTRRWVSPGKAARLVDEKGLKKILRNLPETTPRKSK